MADFQALLAEQKRTSDILSKQRNPLDARTGAGKALLDQQKQTNEKLDRIADATDTSLVEENLSNLAEIFNARLLQSKDERFQEAEGITKTDNLLSNQPNEGEGLYDIQKKYNDASLPLLERMADGMAIKSKDKDEDGDGRQSRFKLPKVFGKIFTPIKAIFGGVKSAFGKVVDGVVGLKKFIPEGIRNALSGLFSKFFGGFKFLLTTAATVLALGFLIKFLRSPEWKEMQKNLIPKLAEGFRFLGEDLVPMVKKGFKELVAVIKEFVADIRDVLDFFGIFEREKRDQYVRDQEETTKERADDLAKRDIPQEILDKQKKIAELEEKLTANPKSGKFKSQLESERLKLQNLIRNKDLKELLNPDGTLKAGAEDYFDKEFVNKENQKLLDQEKKNLEIEKLNKEQNRNIELEHHKMMRERQLRIEESDAKGKSGDTVVAQAKTVNNQQDNTYVAYGKPSFHDTALSHISTSQYA